MDGEIAPKSPDFGRESFGFGLWRMSCSSSSANWRMCVFSNCVYISDSSENVRPKFVVWILHHFTNPAFDLSFLSCVPNLSKIFETLHGFECPIFDSFERLDFAGLALKRAKKAGSVLLFPIFWVRKSKDLDSEGKYSPWKSRDIK